MRALGDLRRKPTVEVKKEETAVPKTEQKEPSPQEIDSTFDESVVLS